MLERNPLGSMIVKHARCLDPNHFDSNNAIKLVKLLLKHLTFLKVSSATTRDNALPQFFSFIQTCLRTEPEKIQAFKPSKERLDDFFFKEMCMILQVIFSISHGQISVEKGFTLNKNPLTEDNEESTIQSSCLIKDHLLSVKL